MRSSSILWIIGYFTIAGASASPLTISLTATSNSDDVTVVASLTNSGDGCLHLIKDPYSVLSNEYDTAKFDILHRHESHKVGSQGVKVVYDLNYGVEVSDFIKLEPNQTVHVSHRLGDIYDFSRSPIGVYDIKPSGNLRHYNVDPISKAVTSITADIMEGGTFHIDAGLIASSHYRMKRGSSRIYGRQYDYPDAQYFGCGGGRKQIVDVAKEKAQQNVNAARRYLHNNVTATKGPIYKKYLGAFTPARLEFVQNRFSDLYGSFYSNTKWYCNCTGSAVSYTISGIHSEWHLCKGFWNAPTENTATKLGKWGIIMRDDFLFDAHGVMPGIPLVDMSQGEDNVLKLAKEDPNSAIINAESNTRFAGAVPPLPE